MRHIHIAAYLNSELGKPVPYLVWVKLLFLADWKYLINQNGQATETMTGINWQFHNGILNKVPDQLSKKGRAIPLNAMMRVQMHNSEKITVAEKKAIDSAVAFYYCKQTLEALTLLARSTYAGITSTSDIVASANEYVTLCRKIPGVSDAVSRRIVKSRARRQTAAESRGVPVIFDYLNVN